jgi:hypothetical protein
MEAMQLMSIEDSVVVGLKDNKGIEYTLTKWSRGRKSGDLKPVEHSTAWNVGRKAACGFLLVYVAVLDRGGK